ncbi:monodehydroascorbate ferredoxin reductase [Ceraceosorus bombacis]|uniref:Monodehydroascorbate ferredoxin reductase n=1 Tax=Ceraceosorus bombacis TaxID=401625 RepID=A0A0P1BFS5_9BASI|nr:monodehydroascorbate ferredoxin reductase [Ceraceosorus bombacis]
MAPQRVKVASSDAAPKPGQHKAFDFAGEGDDKVQVLVTNVGGKLRALSNKCTHYGAPMSNGVMSKDGCLTCPWHGARFGADGDIEEAPGLDSLVQFKIEQDGNGDVYVTADVAQLKGKPGVPPEFVGKEGAQDGAGVVIVGGGAAAIHLVESARKNGYTGPLTILSAEPYAPIDRTKLSKALMADVGAVEWRKPAHLERVLKVSLRTSTEVTGVDVDGKKVKLSNGETVPFDKLVLATGGTPKRLPVPGAKEGELANVFTLRSIQDTKPINDTGIEGKDVVVIGSSFIGLESAVAFAGKKAKSVNVVGMESVPLENVLGKEVGEGLQTALAKKQNLIFHMKAGVSKLQGKDGKVASVIIKDSSGQEKSLPAQIVLLGVGVAPATHFLKPESSPGFPQLGKDGSVAVGSDFAVKGLEGKGIYAAGDIARTPERTNGGEVRIEHWDVAGNHGRFLGQLFSGSAKPGKFDKIPIFWSALGAQLRYCSDGNTPSFDSVHVDGNVAENSFVATYARGDSVVAIATMGRDPVMVQSAELLKIGKMPSFSDVKSGKDLLSISLS